LGILAAATTIALAGCALQARSDVDARASVGMCHTYTFGDAEQKHPDAAPAFANPLNEKRLREAIQNNLAARGMQPAAEAAADCAVGYAIGSRLALDDAYPRAGWGWGWGMGWGWGHRGSFGSLAWQSAPNDYREGRVSVNLYNAHTHEALWHAYVDEDVTRLTGAEAEKRINEAVTAIFAKFPAGTVAAPAAPAAKT
jgi:hypothetical protein